MLAALDTSTCYVGPGYVEVRELADNVHKDVDKAIDDVFAGEVGTIQRRPVWGSLVQLRLTLLSSQAWEVEIPRGEWLNIYCSGRGVRRRPGLDDFSFACSVAGSGTMTRGG